MTIKKYIMPVIIVGVLVTTLGISKDIFADPGSQEDPLVTLSFVEKRIDQVKYYIDQKIDEFSGNVSSNNDELNNKNEELNNRIVQLEQMSAKEIPKLEVVELKDGQKLIAKAGVEIILRGGKATAITSQAGGLSDVTGAIDIKQGQDIPANHLLIIPRDDGRGVFVEQYAIFMIKGEYEIQ